MQIPVNRLHMHARLFHLKLPLPLAECKMCPFLLFHISGPNWPI